MTSVDELIDDALGLLLGDEARTEDEFGEAALKLVGALAMSIEQLAAAVEPLKAGLPVAPATPAGATALGELPDLRTFVVDVAEGGITCGDPNCPALGDLEVPFRRLQVSDLLQRISRHRRSCHTPGVVNAASL